MASNIRARLNSLEVKRKQVEVDQDALSKEIAGYERQACLMVAWICHRKKGNSIASVLPNMLRYVDESEARRLLAMDYDTLYQAIGLPVFTASKTVLPAKSEEMAKPQFRIPGEWGRGR